MLYTSQVGVFTGVYFARPLNPVESISIFQTAPRPATYNVLFFGPLNARVLVQNAENVVTLA